MTNKIENKFRQVRVASYKGKLDICRPGLEEKHGLDITWQTIKGQGRVREIKRTREGG